MAQLDIQRIDDETGSVLSYEAASAGGDSFSNRGNVFLSIKNGGAAPVTVTVAAQAECSHGFTHDAVLTVGAGEERLAGPFNRGRFSDSSGNVQITYSDVTSVTVAAFE